MQSDDLMTLIGFNNVVVTSHQARSGPALRMLRLFAPFLRHGSRRKPCEVSSTPRCATSTLRGDCQSEYAWASDQVVGSTAQERSRRRRACLRFTRRRSSQTTASRPTLGCEQKGRERQSARLILHGSVNVDTDPLQAHVLPSLPGAGMVCGHHGSVGSTIRWCTGAAFGAQQP